MLGSLAIAGCASWSARQPAEPTPPPVPRPVACVEFFDATGHDAGGRLSRTFWRDVRDALGSTGEVVPRPASRLAPSWLKLQGESLRVPVILTGTIGGYRRQARQVWVSITVRLQAVESGRLLWVHRLAATASVSPEAAADAAFDHAVHQLAREFRDVLPSP